jgi:ferredoxin
MSQVCAVQSAASIDRERGHLLARGLHALELALDKLFGAGANPLRQLGALAMWSFWLAVATGAYAYIGFETSAEGAWRSVRALQEHPLEGIVRSLHRYASFALIALALLHLAAEWIKGRYRDFRWFSWVTGIVPLPLAVACGMVGYWLIADTRSQYVAAGIGEWIGALPGVGAGLMRNFITDAAVSDRLLSLIVFLHIGLVLLLLLSVWVHLARLVRPKTWPARRTAVAFGAALLVLCALAPALSSARADFARVPDSVPIDWLIYGLLPLMQATTPQLTWAVVVAATLVLVCLPWLPGHRPAVVPAIVDPQNCNGCRRCFDDCPYGAIVMAPHPRRHNRQIAVVAADQCAACGICVGACPSSSPFRSVSELVTGIDLPQRPLDALRKRLVDALANARAKSARPIVVIGCDHGAHVEELAMDRVASVLALSLPCSAALPPAFAEFAQRAGAAHVLVADCGQDACAYRFGAAFTRERLQGLREPHLRAAARAGVSCITAPAGAEDDLRRAIAKLHAQPREASHA